MIKQRNIEKAEGHFIAGLEHLAKNDFNKAAIELELAIDNDPTYAEAYAYRGRMRSKDRRYTEAIEDYDKSILLYPYDASLYHARGVAYNHKKEYKSAIADFNKALELKPNFVDAYNNRGFAYENDAEVDKSISDYAKAIELGDVSARLKLGNIVYKNNKDIKFAAYMVSLAQLNRTEGAEELFQKIKDEYPKEMSYWTDGMDPFSKGNDSRYLTQQKNIDRISKKRSILYHAIPEKYAYFLERGLLVFDKANNVRELEKDILRKHKIEFSEGMCSRRHNSDLYIDGNKCVINMNVLFDSFFFCLSTSQQIKGIREAQDNGVKRVLYEVDTKELLESIMDRLSPKRDRLSQNKAISILDDGESDKGHWQYFDNKEKYNQDELGLFVEPLGDVANYIKKDSESNDDPYFDKPEYFSNEKEFRLLFNIWEDENINNSKKRRLLTTSGKCKIKIQINNPEKCFKQIEPV